MKRTQVGSTTIDVNISYWTDGKSNSMLRQSERELYSMIDLYQELANITINESERNRLYTEMDKCYAAIWLIDAYGSDAELLRRAGISFAYAIINDQFRQQYSSLDERNEAVNAIIEQMVDNTADLSLSETIAPDIIRWWQSMVLEQNYYLIDGIRCKEPPTATAVIGKTFDEYCADFKKGGMFYLYVAANSALTANYTTAVYKRNQQIQTLERFAECGVGLTRAVTNNNIQAGIIAGSGKTPDNALKDFAAENVSGLIEFIPLIIAAITAIAGIITSIYAVKKAEAEAKAAEILRQTILDAIKPIPIDLNGDGIIDAWKDPQTGQIKSNEQIQIEMNAQADAAKRQAEEEAQQWIQGVPNIALIVGGGLLLLAAVKR